MSDYQIQIGERLVQVPWWWLDALLVWLAALGLIFFLLGRRLVRPAFGAAGLIVGAAAMFAIAAAWIAPRWPAVPPIAFGMVGGILGGLAGFLLWRLGIGVALALTVAILAPAAFLIATGTPGPPVNQPLTEARQELQTTLGAADGPGDAAAGAVDLIQRLSLARDNLWTSTQSWWAALSNGHRWMLGTLCIGGAVLAALIGLALPYFSATLITALVGAVMMLGLIYRLIGMLGESSAAHVPHTSRALMLGLLVATIIGALFQWTIFRPARKDQN